MGDRTTVTLTILDEQHDLARSLMNFEAEESSSDGPVWTYVFHEVNYGDLGFLPAFRNAGVAYDSEWGAGGDYEAGTESCRFTDEGALVLKSIYDNQVNPHMHKLLEYIDQPEMLRGYILAWRDTHSAVPLDEAQVMNAKRYLTLQLIAPRV